jgi:hypothetical protein
MSSPKTNYILIKSIKAFPSDAIAQRRAIGKMRKMKTDEVRVLTIDQVKELGKEE